MKHLVFQELCFTRTKEPIKLNKSSLEQVRHLTSIMLQIRIGQIGIEQRK